MTRSGFQQREHHLTQNFISKTNSFGDNLESAGGSPTSLEVEPRHIGSLNVSKSHVMRSDLQQPDTDSISLVISKTNNSNIKRDSAGGGRISLPVSRRAGFFILLFLALVLPALAQNGAPTGDIKNDLRNQLKEVENKIEEYEKSIQETAQQQKSLKREISLLDKEMEKQQLQIKKINLDLLEVKEGIKDMEKEIDNLEVGLKERRVLLNLSLRKLNEYDRIGWVGIFLKGGDLSDIFNQVRYLENIQNEINVFIANIDQARTDLEDRKTDLEDKKTDIIQLKSLIGLQQASIDRKRREKADLLARTKGQEKLFSAELTKSKKDIQFIKQQLFTLEGMGVSMSLGEAIEKAQFAGEKAGIRPAFLLAIFQVESRLGTYIGGGSWKVDMKPAERPLFLQVTEKLGIDPDTMPVSKKPWYGWGGAMGAAQFIPSTWLAFEKQIASLTGHNPPSPWNIEDAFIGSAIKLSSNGASKKTYAGEFEAAARYLAGGNYKKKVAQGYASTVMDWADYYQNQIDAINGVSAAKNQLPNNI